MKAAELRLGNLVLVDGKVAVVDGIQPEWIWTSDMKSQPYTKYEPIPLTEEWLKKLGFTEISKNDYRIGLPTGDVTDLSIELQDGNCCLLREHYCDGVPTNDFDYCYFKGVAYVHHLQNLYFALTGTELTIKD